MLEFPTEDLVNLSESDPNRALIVALSCLHDDLSSLSEQISDLIEAVNRTI